MHAKNKLFVVGEFGLIDRIRRLSKLDDSVVMGIGDDTAVIKYSKDKYQLLTSDMIIEEVHFLRKMTPEQIGYKALACNISDIAAMGGKALHAVISVGLPKDLDIDFALRIYKGMNDLAKGYKINIVGGDTNQSKKIIINITLLGEVKKRNLVLRSGAKKGDLIFVTGSLGAAKYGREANFIPRIKESRFLVGHCKLNSMIDISDGLIGDLSHILESSRAGAIIYEELIPRSKKVSLKDALYKGEDYELLFTLSKREAIRLMADLKKENNLAPFSFIGIITSKKRKIEVIDKFHRVKVLRPKGYRHF